MIKNAALVSVLLCLIVVNCCKADRLEDQVSWRGPDKKIEVSIVRQTFVSRFNDLSEIQVQGESAIPVELSLKEGEKNIRLVHSTGSGQLRFNFDPIHDSQNKKYELIMKAKNKFQVAILTNRYSHIVTGGSLRVNGKYAGGDLSFRTYDDVRLSLRKVMGEFYNRLIGDKWFVLFYLIALLVNLGALVNLSFKNIGNKK